MKKSLFRFSIFNLTLLLFLTVGCGKQVESEEQAKSLSDADLVANQELDQRFKDAMDQMDIEKLMSCLWNSPDLIFVDFDGNVNRGYDNIRKVFEQFFDQFESLSLVCDEISHIRAGNSVSRLARQLTPCKRRTVLHNRLLNVGRMCVARWRVIGFMYWTMSTFYHLPIHSQQS